MPVPKSAVRALGDGSAREGVTLALFSQANAVLAEITTDADGNTTFPAGMTSPVPPQNAMIGIKPEFDDVLPEVGEATFDLIATEKLSDRWTLNRVASIRSYQPTIS